MDFSVITDYMPMYMKSVGVTLEVTIYSLILGFIIAIPLAIMKISGIKILNAIGRVYTSIFRGIPLLVQIMLVYFATPQLVNYKITAMQAGAITFACNSAAYISESLRGGILAVDRGQWEASKALGIPYGIMMKDIIMPQALKSILPGLVNESISLLKNTSLVATIGLVDILRTGQLVMNSTYRAFEPLLVSALIYYIIVTIMSAFASLLERRVKASDLR